MWQLLLGIFQVIQIITNSTCTSDLRVPDTGSPPPIRHRIRSSCRDHSLIGKDQCDGILWNTWPNSMYAPCHLQPDAFHSACVFFVFCDCCCRFAMRRLV
jgi:hypothetical protein